ESAVSAVIDQLGKHGMTALSENQSITLERSREILENAIA
ncbi:NADH-dependent alcohol dehydrogenase, partial [Photobacterium damselae]